MKIVGGAQQKRTWDVALASAGVSTRAWVGGVWVQQPTHHLVVSACVVGKTSGACSLSSAAAGGCCCSWPSQGEAQQEQQLQDLLLSVAWQLADCRRVARLSMCTRVHVGKLSSLLSEGLVVSAATRVAFLSLWTASFGSYGQIAALHRHRPRKLPGKVEHLQLV